MSSENKKKLIFRISMKDSKPIGNSLMFDNDRETQIVKREVENLKPPICYLIVNDEFKTQKERKCAAEDEKLIREGLKMFHIEPEVLLNLDKSEIIDKMKEIENLDLSKHSGIMIIISSHGDENDMICASDESYSLDNDVIKTINKNETLKNKIKIFVIQACKGSNKIQCDAPKTSEIFKISEEDYMKVIEEVLQIVDENENEQGADVLADFTYHGNNKMIKAYSTFEGFVSYRDYVKEGSDRTHSIFLKVFKDFLIKYGQDKSVYSILNSMPKTVQEIVKNMKKVITISSQNNKAIGKDLQDDLNDQIKYATRTISNLKPPLCYFFLNNKFLYKSYRNCAVEDEKIVKNGLEMFHIYPEVLKDKTKEEILKKIAEIEKLDFTDYSGLIIIISSHGSENDIINAYDDDYNLNTDMIDRICEIPTLKDKMKIFFVQACKGYDEAFRADNDRNENPEPFVISEDDYQRVMDEILQIPIPEETPEIEDASGLETDCDKKDIIIAFATFEGYVALRAPVSDKYYSIYLKILFDMLREFRRNNIFRILDKTQDGVRKFLRKYPKNKEKMDQVPSYRTYGIALAEKFIFQDFVLNGDAKTTYIGY